VTDARAIVQSNPKPVVAGDPYWRGDKLVKAPAVSSGPVDSSITKPQQKILDSIAWLESVNLYKPKRTVVAFLAGQSPRSSGFKNNLSSLKSLGLLLYSGNDAVEFTDSGRSASFVAETPITPEEVQKAILGRLPRPQSKILELLITEDGAPVDRSFLAVESGQSPTSSGFKNNLSALRSIGIVDYHGPDKVKALPVLFLR